MAKGRLLSAAMVGSAFAAVLLLACQLVVRTDDLHPEARAEDASADTSFAADAPVARDAGRPAAACLAADAACPGTEGPTMIRAGCFCIDATEITNRQYARFAGQLRADAVLPAACAWKAAGLPASVVPDNGLQETDTPVTAVDWCDAWLYCAWAGKRLCGSITGGSADLGAPDDRDGQWYVACSRDGATEYPYGPSFVGARCNDGAMGATPAPLLPPATKSACQGGYAGLFDMSGNASEWEDACSDAKNRFDRCGARGGNAPYAHTEYLLSCGSTQPNRRDFRGAGLGFRCCSP